MRGERGDLARAAGIVVALIWLALLAPAGAGAAAPKFFARFPANGAAGDGAGQLDFPQGIATEAKLPGDLYIAEWGNERISVLTPWGEFVRAFGWGVVDGAAELQTCTAETGCRKGLRGSGTGQFDRAASVALDSSGDLYATDKVNPRVQKFDSEGNFLRMWGWDVVASGPGDDTVLDPEEDEFEVCVPAEGDVCQAGVAGGGKGQIESDNSAGRLAIGPEDTVFLADGERIEKFSSEGAYLEEIEMPEAGEGEGATALEVKAIAVDAEGKLYVSFRTGPEVNVIRKLESIAPYKEVEPKEFKADENIFAPLLALDSIGHLYATVTGLGEPRRVLEFDPEGNCLDCGTDGEGGQSGFDRSEASQLQGIATGAACGPTNVYVSHHDTGVGVNRDYLKVFGPHPDTDICPPPEVPPTIEASWAAAVDLREAELAASINPHYWADTTYQLQYGTEPCSEGGCETVPAAPRVLSEEVTDKALTASVSLDGLQPATTYHYRFLAKSTGSGGEEVHGVGGAPGADGAEGTFRTFAIPEPEGCPDGVVRSGADAYLPDCRTYELVSPLDKNNGDVVPGPAFAIDVIDLPAGLEQSSVSGNRLAYSSATAFADAQSAPFTSQYIADRVAGEGWQTHAISPPRGRVLGDEEGAFLRDQDTEFKVFSPDLCDGWLRTQTDAPLAAGEVAGSVNVYRRSDRLCTPGGEDSYEALTTITPLDGDLGLDLEIQGVSADGQVALYRSPDSLPGTGASEALQGKNQLYARGAGGQTRFACVLPAGAATSCLAGTTFGAAIPGYWASLEGAISANGTRVFWSTPALGGGAIYARENPLAEPSAQEHGSAIGTGVLRAGKTEVTSASASKGAFEAGQRVLGEGIPVGTTIVAVAGNVLTLSEPATVEGISIASLEAFSPCTEPAKACTVPVSSAAEALSGTDSSIFLTAAADASRVIFLIKGKGISDLYEFDLQSEATRKIASAAAGIMGASQDASVTYFISTEAIEAAAPNAEGAEPEPGDTNLYRYGAGDYRFIAALAEDDAQPGEGEGRGVGPVALGRPGHLARVSPDGGVLAFTSVGNPTGYDNTDQASGEPAAEVYRYDAKANSGQGKLLCASCNPSGARPVGRELKRGRQVAAALPGWANSFYAPRVLSEDGKRVFFESYDALTPRDSNGRADVYGWQAPGTGTCTTEAPSFSAANGGCLYLLSSGTSPRDSEFRDADPCGANVFFATLSSLAPSDYGLVDIYDARAQGGLPLPTEAPPHCEEGEGGEGGEGEEGEGEGGEGEGGEEGEGEGGEEGEGEACQFPPGPPAAQTPASGAFRGPWNLPAAARCAKPPRCAGAAARRRAMRRRARRFSHRAGGHRKRARRCRARVRRRLRR